MCESCGVPPLVQPTAEQQLGGVMSGNLCNNNRVIVVGFDLEL